MASVLNRALIVMAGSRTDVGRPSTCFTFSHRPERSLLELFDDFETEDDLDVEGSERMQ